LFSKRLNVFVRFGLFLEILASEKIKLFFAAKIQRIN